jgi:hypothetical protein
VPKGALGMYVTDRFRSREELVNVSYKGHTVLSMRTPEEMVSDIHFNKRNNNMAKMDSMLFKNAFSVIYEDS